MKISFEKLGALESGRFEISDLTIICGENNTGKTYVTYAVYCLLKSWISLTRLGLSIEMNALREAGVVSIDIKSKIIDAWPYIKTQVIKNFLDAFPAMMASRGDLFIDTKLDCEIEFGEKWKTNPFTTELRSENGRLLVSINKPADSTIAEITAAGQIEHETAPVYGLQEFIEEALISIVLTDIIPNVFMASTERTGATIFKNDLNLAKNSVVDLLTQMHRDGSNELNPGKVFATLYRRNYARPVDDNVRFANTLPGPDHEIGPLVKKHPELLDYFGKIVGGLYVTSREGVTYFQPAGTKLKLGLGESSSAVRSQLILWYWLKYLAKSGDLLMIDEPELNLHPANQRRLARFITCLVNHGVKVFITTHSDTIIREFNTLIMMARKLPHFEAVKKKYGYEEWEALNSQKVRAYYTGLDPAVKKAKKQMILNPVKITPNLGIDVKTFDYTILEMASMQDDLRYGGD